MTMQQILLAALDQYRGDDLERATRAFSKLTPEQLNAPYGESGLTRAQILANYRTHADEVDAARQWVKDNT